MKMPEQYYFLLVRIPAIYLKDRAHTFSDESVFLSSKMKDNRIHKILLVVNPVSGDTDKQPYIQYINDWISNDAALSILKTTGKNDLDAIREAIAADKPDRILVMGGDGTLRDVAEANQATLIPLGILPAGSANGLATALDLPMDINKALPYAMGADLLDLDLLCVNNELCLHIGDLGLNAELIKNYHEKDRRGYFGYALNIVPTLQNTNVPHRFTIKTNGREFEREAIVVAFTNVQKYGTGAVINPMAIPDDGKFEVLIFKKFDLIEILKTFTGKVPLREDFAEVIHTTRASISSEDPMYLQLDGEFAGQFKTVDVSLYPGKLKLAAGAEAGAESR